MSRLKAEDVQKGGLEQEVEPCGKGTILHLLEDVGNEVLLGKRECTSFLLVPQPQLWESG